VLTKENYTHNFSLKRAALEARIPISTGELEQPGSNKVVYEERISIALKYSLTIDDKY